ncbi:hypothetical protein D3C78_1740890 [compost metagenome]
MHSTKTVAVIIQAVTPVSRTGAASSASASGAKAISNSGRARLSVRRSGVEPNGVVDMVKYLKRSLKNSWKSW